MRVLAGMQQHQRSFKIVRNGYHMCDDTVGEKRKQEVSAGISSQNVRARMYTKHCQCEPNMVWYLVQIRHRGGIVLIACVVDGARLCVVLCPLSSHLHRVLFYFCSFNLSSISSRSSALSISIMRFTSLVFRISSFAPAYSIFTSLLHVMGR